MRVAYIVACIGAPLLALGVTFTLIHPNAFTLTLSCVGGVLVLIGLSNDISMLIRTAASQMVRMKTATATAQDQSEPNEGLIWYYARGGRQIGPVSANAMKKLALKGELLSDDLVWRKGLSRWVSAGSVGGLDFARAEDEPPPLPSENGIDGAIRANPPVNGIHVQRIAMMIGACLGMSATFMPWVHLPIVGTFSGTQGDGWITFALFLMIFIHSVSGKRAMSLRGLSWVFSQVWALAAVLLGIWKISQFQKILNERPKDNNPFTTVLQASIQIGNGIYIVIVAGIAISVMLFVLNGERRQRLNHTFVAIQ